jgi:hypothetical protein
MFYLVLPAGMILIKTYDLIMSTMKRDGATASLWQQGTDTFIPQNAWDPAARYDVLIVGGGITGVTTALLLQEAGLNCIIAEAHTLAFGTTGGTTAHLNTILDTPYYQIAADFGTQAAIQIAAATREAIDTIAANVARFNIDCEFTLRDGYIFARNQQETEELVKIYDGNIAAGIGSEWVHKIPVPVPFENAVCVPAQASFNPVSYVYGLARAFGQLGGIILQNCMVSDVKGDEELTADTSLGSITARNLIYATHIPPGINAFSFKCAPYRSYAMAFTLRSGEYPEGLAYDLDDPYHYYRSQVLMGTRYVIAGGFDHKTGHQANTQHIFTELEAYMRGYFHIGDVVHRWSSQYYESIDGLPYIGRIHAKENHFGATGFGGNGMIFGTLSAIIFRDLLRGQITGLATILDPARLKVVSGFARLIKENADVIEQFIDGRFSYQYIDDLAQLAHGEARIADWGGKKVALYKNDAGHIYVLDPVCTHAHCIVTWNNAEKTWDCPCHGARYAANGDLLTGPAVHGLKQVKWEDIEGD